MSAIREQKAALRKAIRQKLRQMDKKEARLSDEMILARVKKLPAYQKANTIFAFVGVKWEIHTDALIRDALLKGNRVAVPLCVKPGIMEARLIRSMAELKPGIMDIPEPKEHCPVCPPREIDFALIPCVSCDSSCMRLGQGGGFYDRFLAESHFFKAAVCRDLAITRAIPTEPWDLPVDCVVTETALYETT